ncbi:MAG: UvrD-helicase domain-containing protein [Armatimonadetes bacterium]|nr:UvrD-helicase domain-containing protein [Armatimonadota bacterium]
MRPTSKLNLTDEQRAVVASQEAALVVRAAAGSGKTAVLAERYLKHVVEDRLSPDSILTLTFTKKAAAEMKQRIVRRLSAAGLHEAAQASETGPIQTIHSFCERLLRENAIEAGIDPDFEILGEADGARELQRAIEVAIASAEGLEDLVVHALSGKREQGSPSPFARLESTLKGALLNMRGSGLPRTAWEARHREPETLLAIWRDAMLDGLAPAVRRAFEEADPSVPFGLRIVQAHKSLKHKAPKGAPTPAKIEDAEAADRACAEMSCGLAQLACRAWKALEARLSELRSLDFTSLEDAAIAILEGYPHVREKLQRQYRVALIDEAQDLSPAQHGLFRALGIALEMRVGDASQSIYGFRQADVRLFQEHAEATAGLTLSRNFRSTDGILAFVDSVFGRLWQEGHVRMSASVPLGEQPPPSEGVEIWRQRVKDTSRVAEWVEDLLGTEDPGDVAVLVRGSKYAQDLYARLEAKGVPARIIGGSERFYTRLEVRDLANALTAVEDPTDDFALLATLRSPIVGLSLDSIVLLATQKPVHEALPSFAPPFEEDLEPLERFRSWFEPLRLQGDRLGAWEVLSAIFAQSDYLPNLALRLNGRQSVANVRKLLMLAAERPDVSPRAYASILREVAELKHREGDAPATNVDDSMVNILTVHKAKGLEFPVVVVPDTHGALCRNRQEVEIDKRQGLLTTAIGCPEVSMFHDWIAEKRKDRERAEELRLLYVAMTRSERRLCLVSDPQARANSAARLLAETLGLPDHLPDGVKVRDGG